MNRVLLVESDSAERLILSSRLAESGYQVSAVESGAQGLTHARQESPDFVLVSVALAGGATTAEVAQRLKANPATAQAPVLAYSTSPVLPEQAQRLYEAGCDAVLGHGEMTVIESVLSAHRRIQAKLSELKTQNRLISGQVRRLEEQSQTVTPAGAGEAGQAPSGLILVDEMGMVCNADRGAMTIFGARCVGRALGQLAPGSGLEAFVRDNVDSVSRAFRFQLRQANGQRDRILRAVVIPASVGSSASGKALRAVLLHDRNEFAPKPQEQAVASMDDERVFELKQAARMLYSPAALRGSSAVMEDLRRRVTRVATRPGCVLVQGPVGTEHDLVVRVLHWSGRQPGPLVQVPCGAYGAEYATRLLFGQGSERGLLETNCGGTIVLEDVHLLDRSVQDRLADRLDDGLSTSSEDCAVPRLLATTSLDLEERADLDQFNPVLLGHLFHHRIELPPLSARRQDIPALAEAYLATNPGPRGFLHLTAEAAEVLMDQEWPGNLRELEQALTDASARAEGSDLDVQHFVTGVDLAQAGPARTASSAHIAGRTGPVAGPRIREGAPSQQRPWEITDEDPISLDHYEMKALLRALDATGGDKLEAAKLLNLGKSTLYRKLKRFGIR